MEASVCTDLLPDEFLELPSVIANESGTESRSELMMMNPCRFWPEQFVSSIGSGYEE